MIPASRAAAIAYGSVALLLIYLIWFVLYRRFRTELLQERLSAVRDESTEVFFGSPRSPHAAPLWLDLLISRARVFTPTRWVLAVLCRRIWPRYFKLIAESAPATTRADCAAAANRLIRDHLIIGCLPLWVWLRHERSVDSHLIWFLLQSDSDCRGFHITRRVEP